MSVANEPAGASPRPGGGALAAAAPGCGATGFHSRAANWYASRMEEIERAVDTVVNQCLGVKAGENVLVVADTTTRRMGNVLREAAATAGADAVVMVMDPRRSTATSHRRRSPPR